MVKLQGRVGMNAYKANDKEAKASLTFHVNSIKLHGSAGVNNETTVKKLRRQLQYLQTICHFRQTVRGH